MELMVRFFGVEPCVLPILNQLCLPPQLWKFAPGCNRQQVVGYKSLILFKNFDTGCLNRRLIFAKQVATTWNRRSLAVLPHLPVLGSFISSSLPIIHRWRAT